MATYIVLCNFTEQGIRNIKDTTTRADALKEAGRKVGVNMKEIYWTLGSYDIVTIMEAPDDSAATAFVLGIGAAGNVRTQMLRGFSKEEMKSIIGTVTKSRASVPA